MQKAILGWTVEANPTDQAQGKTKYNLDTPHQATVCNSLHVWCCWR